MTIVFQAEDIDEFATLGNRAAQAPNNINVPRQSSGIKAFEFSRC